MPEGPEVRRHADTLASALVPHPLVSLTARTKVAKAWLGEHPGLLDGRRVESVRSRGKNLVGRIEGGYYFYSHLMMWGRWHVFDNGEALEVDRRERARLTVTDATAILFSAPVFELGKGDPFQSDEYLRSLGPDSLPYPGEGPFDAACFVARLHSVPHQNRTIGAALLDQTIVAGIGNYLRAEILFECRLDPWRRVSEMSGDELACLCETLPAVVARAYETAGTTVPDDAQARMRNDAALVYNPESDWGTRHWVFRRTNLPCLVCGEPIRQKRQVTREDEDGDKERIIYFCPVCQGTTVPLPPIKRKTHPARLRLATLPEREGEEAEPDVSTPPHTPVSGGPQRSGEVGS